MALIGVTATVRSALRPIRGAIENSVQRLVRETADGMVSDIRHGMESGKTGRVYPPAHIASAPGQSPAIWTGQLYASIHSRRITGYDYRVEASAPYARYLEFGTSKMRPRPFLRPAARKARDSLRRRGATSVRLAVAKAGLR